MTLTFTHAPISVLTIFYLDSMNFLNVPFKSLLTLSKSFILFVFVRNTAFFLHACGTRENISTLECIMANTSEFANLFLISGMYGRWCFPQGHSSERVCFFLQLLSLHFRYHPYSRKDQAQVLRFRVLNF